MTVAGDLTVELQVDDAYLTLSNAGNTSAAYTLDTAVLDITGDIDLRVDLAAQDWTPAVDQIIAAKFSTTGNNRAWVLRLLADGRPVINWSPDGSAGNLTADARGRSSLAPTVANGYRLALRVTVDVNNGAGGTTVTWYTAPDITGPWTPLGTPIVTATTVAIAATAATLELGTGNGGTAVFANTNRWIGRIYAFRMYNGIAGTSVAYADFRRQDEGTTYFTDVHGLTWNVSGRGYVQRGWIDVTGLGDVREQQAVAITRGRSNETSTAPPTSCALTLDNRDGRYSPRNPTGPYFGRLGRNTPLRTYLSGAAGHVFLRRSPEDYVVAPDSAGLSIVGDIDLRIDLDLFSWDGPTIALIDKFNIAGNQRSYTLVMENGGLTFSWSTDGTQANTTDVFSTAGVPAPRHGRKAVRATLDVNNGAGGHTVTFYTADTIAGPWIQLGNPVVGTGVTSIYDSTAQVSIGARESTPTVDGAAFSSIYGIQIRNGIDGSLVASPDFTTQNAGTLYVLDGQGTPWSLIGSAELRAWNARAHVEVANWPQEWDLSGADVRTAIEASGILRRLGQGKTPLKSALYRGITGISSAVARPVAYWPCEDGQDATRIGAAVPGAPAMTFTGEPRFAAFADFRASTPLPELNGSVWTGAVPDYTSTNIVQTRFVLAVPDGGVPATMVLCRIELSGSGSIWHLSVDASGNLRIQCYDIFAVELFDSGPIAFDVNGRLLRVSIDLVQDGADIDASIHVLEVGASVGAQWAGTLSGRTVGQARTIIMNYSGAAGDVVLGHIAVYDTAENIFDLFDELNAFHGETAAERFIRLCGEEGIPCAVKGSWSDTVMGYRLSNTLLDLLREVERTDGGILYEDRRFFGLVYRTRASLYSQQPALVLDYANAEISAIKPRDDDQGTRNAVTVQRTGGGSAVAQQTSGPLNLADPPDGVGRYESSVEVSLPGDETLPDHAGWRLHLGTTDESRYPTIGINLVRTLFTGDPARTAAALALDVGDLIAIDNPPPWLPPDQIRQLVQGLKEMLSGTQLPVQWNGQPASPWDIAVYDDPASRWSSDGSILAADADATSTTLTVATPTGPLWINSDGRMTGNPDFEVDASGWDMFGGMLTRAVTPPDAGGRPAPFAGSWSGRLVPDGTSATAYVESVPKAAATAGSRYYFHAWLRCETGHALQLNANWFTAGGSYLSTSTIQAATVAAGQWTRFAGVATAPATAGLVTVDPGVPGTPATTDILYMDVVFVAAAADSLSAELPMDITVAGERMLVTDIAGGTSPQTFTVVRAVNGVEKDHEPGEELTVCKPVCWGL
ncbi:hypothetical protein [Protofrankia coriariae]|uniref:Uncharacterized protein n=1 Tax=Protofrankia coriariae TaxID=1562887 RepID=A0ABR5F4C2_9ACTN|nr:hypothetical protein [Protofrankia coriariae]KLL11575.1 hypothetical protein FrCorBMG51_11100 [Protofrankia coriariae]